MKFYLQNAEEVFDGIELLKEDLNITPVSEDAAEVTVQISQTDHAMLTVTCAPGEPGKALCAHIIYGGGKARFFRALSLLCEALVCGKTTFSLTETPTFATNGAMFDMSRNAVMNVRTVKYTLRKMALLGMNTFMLYTEDTFSVKERPYFGYMRGRYTKEEIKELDRYALALGIELVPCIQMLGHLATYLRWPEANAYQDSASTLLSGAQETYAFLEDVLRTVAECFTSRRLHMGMDETHDLGRGRAMDLYGYRESKDLYFAHLQRVTALAKKYGFRPMMWSDMFFRLSAAGMPQYTDYDVRTVLLPEVGQLFPEGVQPVFWDYYHANEEFYAVNLQKHAQFSKNVLFAGGVWAWSGYCVQFSRSVRSSVPALEACRKSGTKEVVATVWHNGSEASELMALAGLALYAAYDYHGHYDVQEIRAEVRRILHTSYDDFLLTEAIEYPHGDNSKTGVSRALVYNDPLCGLIDKHIEKLHTGEYYRALTPNLLPLSSDKGELSPAFTVLSKLSALLENKADFGVRLKAAYDARDRAALAALAEECTVICQKTEELRCAHREAWMRWNKPFGWEVHDIRYGGLLTRFETAKARITGYLDGTYERLEELEEPRLRADGTAEDAPAFGGKFLWKKYVDCATVNIL